MSLEMQRVLTALEAQSVVMERLTESVSQASETMRRMSRVLEVHCRALENNTVMMNQLIEAMVSEDGSVEPEENYLSGSPMR